MAKLKLPDNGQEIDIDDVIARDDAQLKQALAVVMPGAANMEIKREEKDGQLIVSVIKKAGSKGNALADLINATEYVNPALALAARVRRMEESGAEPEEFIDLQEEAEKAVGESEAVMRYWRDVLHSLRFAPAVVVKIVPKGF